MFEKLGWMVLAHAKYKKSINHLIESIKHLMKEYKDKNNEY